MKQGARKEAPAGARVTSSTEEIIEDMRNGRMVILVDAEDRENEGDLVVAAQMATPDTVNFMAKHGRGLICLTLSEARGRELDLKSMVRANRSRTGTAFTVSIEAREGISTGISAHDRARTIQTAIDPSKGAADIVSPGHIFPLIAREGGTLVRAGHTEASVDLARLAGLNPAAVICEIMNDDGSMARLPDLVPFAKLHGLKIGTIDDLIAYRLRNDRIVKRTAASRVETAFGGQFDLHVYESAADGVEHLALVKGDLRKQGPVLVRVHAIDPFADLMGIGDVPADGSVIAKALRAIEKEGRGVLVLIRDTRQRALAEWVTRHEGGGAGASQAPGRRQVEIGVGSQILRDLGVSEMVLLTRSPAHVYTGVEAFGLAIAATRRID